MIKYRSGNIARAKQVPYFCAQAYLLYQIYRQMYEKIRRNQKVFLTDIFINN